MKKFIFFTVISMFAVNAFGGNCTPHDCTPTSEDTSELLTLDGYTREITGKNNNDKSYGYFLGKQCFFCDTGGNDTECNYGNKVFLPNSVSGKHFFQCLDTAGVDDSWKSMDEERFAICKKSPLQNMTDAIEYSKPVEYYDADTNKAITTAGRYNNVCRWRECASGYTADNTGTKCVNSDMAACLAHSSTVWDGYRCHCTSDLLYWHPEKQKCVKESECDGKCSDINVNVVQNNQQEQQNHQSVIGQNNNSGDKGGQVVPNPQPKPSQKCVDRCSGMSGAKKSECQACCDLPATVAVWNGNTCTCTNTSLKFDVIKRQCLPNGGNDDNGGGNDDGNGGGNDDKHTVIINNYCNITVMIELNNYVLSSGADSQIVNEIHQLQNVCSNTDISVRANELLAKINQLRADMERISEINTASTKLTTLTSGLKASKWKTAEGKFNGARLASDSVAGVVLGTAGGLITSSVMKKKQAENGFEDIHCYIGGQSVADYEDVFSVGLQ